MNDLISREAAIDAIYKNHMNGKEGVKQDLENLYGSAVCFSETLQDAVESIEELPAVHAILIPENATNGDMIKVMFPNAEFDNAMPFTDGRWETMNLDTENRTRAIYKPTQLRTYADWWNSPYKRGETE